ncbi:phage tail spike protein (plasmid) [Paenibacillus glucanolyticus]
MYDKQRNPIGVLPSAYDIARTRRLNSDYTLTFSVPMTSEDYREKIALKGYVQDERGQLYVINSRQRSRDGRKLTAQISCSHVMFRLTDYKIPYSSYMAEGYGISITQLTDRIAAATGGRFSFVIHDTFPLHDVKDWGRTTALAALNDVINMYGAEVEPDNFTIHLRKRVGGDNGHQYRIGKNIVSETFTDDGSTLTTRLFAQMKDGRTWIGQPASILTADERARLQAIPGAIVNGNLAVNYLISQYVGVWSTPDIPYYDNEIVEQNITNVAELLEKARKELADSEVPALSINVDAADVYKLDDTESRPNLGDTVYCVDPEMELPNITARIMEITEYPYDRDKNTQVTVANVMSRDYADIVADLDRAKRTINDIMSGGTIRTDVFEAFAKQAVIDIDNSKTEIKYDQRGIILQDKTNPLRQVIMTSNGIILTTDGGVTARTAITPSFINAEVINGQLGSFVSLLIGSGNNVTQINPNGIAAGHATFSSAPFQVKMNGDVIARSITLTGQIENSKMQSSEITGGTITGALLRTAASGARVEIDIRGWRTYDSSNRERISINTDNTYGMNAIEFNKASGVRSGSINGGDDLFQIQANNDMFLMSTGTIYTQGNVSFSGGSVSGLTLPMSSVTGLVSEINALWSAISGKASANHTHTVTLPTHNHGNPANQNWGGTFTTSTP